MPNAPSDPESDPDAENESGDDSQPPESMQPPRGRLGERLLNAAERRFGKFAIPGVVRFIAILQGLTYILVAAFEDYYAKLVFDKALILDGQVWRLVTYLFTPPGNIIPGMGTGNFLIVLLVILFMFLINDGLEQAWGAFRLNVYLFSTMLLMTIAVFIFNTPLDPGFLTFTTLLIAFSIYFPHVKILFMLFIPLRIMWLGWFSGVVVVITFAGAVLSGDIGTAAVILAGMTPFLVVFVPGFIASRKLAAENAVRREKFQSGMPDAEEAFHRCSVCDATEHSHPEKEFRVSSDGEEYCLEHIPQANNP